jgi:hypothetical protein
VSAEARTTAPMVALLFGAIASLLPSWAGVPVLLYDPVTRAVRFARLGAYGGPAVEITFYGTYLFAFVAFIIGALLGLLIEKRWPRARLLSAWTMTALSLAAAYQIWTLW